MSTKIEMKVTSVSHDPPMHMGGYMGPKPRIPNLPIFLSLFPSEERWPIGVDASEKLIERPVEKVRIKTETEGEREAQIIRPMVGPFYDRYKSLYLNAGPSSLFGFLAEMLSGLN